jgi:cell division septum initiation protein DivIVA
MTIELHVDGRTDGGPGPLLPLEAAERTRPNVAGDLDDVLGSAPMFRRAIAGYDRFEVQSYVQWAETELATADREREHLLARQLETRAALDEARELLGHSSGGGEFLQVSRRIGTLMATAADEADAMRSEAAADRRAAASTAEQTIAVARHRAADLAAQAERTLGEARAAAGALLAEARQDRDAARETGVRARAEADERLEGVAALERRAADEADVLRERAATEAATALLHARQEVVALLSAGRDERRRADDAAAAVRTRLDDDAAARRAALLTELDVLSAEVAELQQRRADLRAHADHLADTVAAAQARRAGRRLLAPLRLTTARRP